MKKIIFIILLFSFLSNYSQSKKIDDLTFLNIDEAPIYNGCEKFDTNLSREKCMNKLLTDHIQNNFDFSIVNCLSHEKIYNRQKRKLVRRCIRTFLPGEKNFTITESGTLKNINIRAPHSKLKEEAFRVAKLIPKLTPGKQKGESIKINYTHPIDFTVK